jgi:hypothetical protein
MKSREKSRARRRSLHHSPHPPNPSVPPFLPPHLPNQPKGKPRSHSVQILSTPSASTPPMPSPASSSILNSPLVPAVILRSSLHWHFPPSLAYCLPVPQLYSFLQYYSAGFPAQTPSLLPQLHLSADSNLNSFAARHVWDQPDITRFPAARVGCVDYCP